MNREAAPCLRIPAAMTKLVQPGIAGCLCVGVLVVAALIRGGDAMSMPGIAAVSAPVPPERAGHWTIAPDGLRGKPDIDP